MNNFSEIFEIIEHVSSISSTNEKIEYMKTVKDTQNLREVFNYALNKDITFGISAIPSVQANNKKVNVKKFFEFLDKLISRKLTGNAAKEALAKFLECNKEEQQVIEFIINRKLGNSGISVKNTNKIWENQFVQEIKLMKAQAYSLKNLEKINFPAVSQQKMDGARCLVFKINGNVTMFSSGNKEFHHLDALKKNVESLKEDNIVIDGELLVIREGKVQPRKIGNGVLNSSIHNSDGDYSEVHMTFWDVVPLKNYESGKGTREYSETIKLYSDVDMSNLHFVEEKIVKTRKEAIAHFRKMIERGEEGTIIKNLDSKWEGKRSKNCVKMKIIQEFTLRLVDIVEGTGKYQNMMGAIVCESEDHKVQVTIGSGFTDEERVDFWTNRESLIKKQPLVEMLANGIISSENKDTYSLFLPRFEEFRTDKKEADTYEYIKALSSGSEMLVEGE